jgi:hypothetical protein
LVWDFWLYILHIRIRNLRITSCPQRVRYQHPDTTQYLSSKSKMDGQGSSSQSVATQHRMDTREERPLPPYPGTSQHVDGEFHVDPRDAALYARLVTGTQEGVNDSSQEYEWWRESGYRGSPRSYSRGEGELGTSSSLPGQAVSTPSQVSRSRGSSASQRIGEKRAQASEAVNEMRANRPFRIDGPSNPRRTSSSTSARGSTSSMSAHQSDGSSSGGDTPLLSHTSPSQNRRRRVAESTEVVVPRWQPDVEVTFCPICRTQFSMTPFFNFLLLLLIYLLTLIRLLCAETSLQVCDSILLLIFRSVE